MKIAYRPEIDGLRAIAVLPVILFHAGLTTFSGGFVGVDVFFVISGYLITSIIVSDLEGGTFSFWKFYERRARRILPALFLVILACIPFAWMWMMPKELEDFSASVISVCLFLSNLLFWRQSGYFDTATELKPLLHTWSLAVEEQFYIIFPVAMLLLWRYGRKGIILSISLIAVLSLLLSQYASIYHASFNFFWLPTRAWELMSGALCSFLFINPSPKRDNFLSVCGLAGITLSVFLYDENIPFPSTYALLPAVGACAIILFARKGTYINSLLTLKPIVGVGIISYSTYLWHQPLFAFARIRSITEPSSQFMLVLAALSLVFGYLSWRYVEIPFRSRPVKVTSRWKTVFLPLILTAAFLMVIGISGYTMNGIPQRLSPEVIALIQGRDEESHYHECLRGLSLNEVIVEKGCQLGAPKGKVDFLLFGDSYAAAISEGINVAAIAENKHGYFFGVPTCPPIIAIGGTHIFLKYKCRPFQRSILDIVEQTKPEKVILHADWAELDNQSLIKENRPDATSGVEAFKEPLLQTLQALKRLNVDVYIICCIPNSKGYVNIPYTLARMKLYEQEYDIRESTKDFKERNRTAFELFSNDDIRHHAKILYLTDHFCPADMCNVTLKGRSLFFDHAHLSIFGSKTLAPLLKTIF